MSNDPEFPRQMTPEEAKARSKRNVILALALVAFMAIVMLITMTRLKSGVARNQDWDGQAGAEQAATAPAETGQGDSSAEAPEL